MLGKDSAGGVVAAEPSGDISVVASVVPSPALLRSSSPRLSGETAGMRTRPRPAPVPRSAFAGFRFPPDVIVLAVRWYPRFGLSYRDVEELLAERRIEVDHITVYRWVQRSRRCSLRPPGRAGTPSATAGGWTRRM
jgi:hypothetical protein